MTIKLSTSKTLVQVYKSIVGITACTMQISLSATTPATSKAEGSSEREGSADETSREKTTEFAHSSAETPEPKESTTEGQETSS